MKIKGRIQVSTITIRAFLNEFKRQERLARKKRICLSCGKEFHSQSAYNRMCTSCLKKYRGSIW